MFYFQSKYRYLLICLIYFKSLTLHNCMIIKFTKLECQAFDKSYAEFKLCQLKAVGRDKIALNINVNLHERPLNNITVSGWKMGGRKFFCFYKCLLKLQLSAQLFRKSHDFRPFLYNDTFDFCLFMKNSNRFLFWKTLVQDLSQYSNINHTCPFDVSWIVVLASLDFQ